MICKDLDQDDDVDCVVTGYHTEWTIQTKWSNFESTWYDVLAPSSSSRTRFYYLENTGSSGAPAFTQNDNAEFLGNLNDMLDLTFPTNEACYFSPKCTSSVTLSINDFTGDGLPE